MTKSIRYKITQIENVVVFAVMTTNSTKNFLDIDNFTADENDVCINIIDIGAQGYTMKNPVKASGLVHQIHAAIHKEFAGEWEPKEGEEVLVKDAEMDEPESDPQKFLMTDSKGRHWTAACSNIAYAWDELEPFKKTEIPTGPCEVCYGIEGCEDGVQPDPVQEEYDRVCREKEKLEKERDADKWIAAKAKEAKEKPVIRLDRETVESTWGASMSFFDQMKSQMINQGYDFDWIGGGE